jgi:HD-GYP domain-containing protein (c-di-GMP phosphodiesterase class II)
VAELSVAVARQIGCNPHEIESIRLAALLHDIGKISLPTEIVTTTTDKLSELQKKVYFTHAVRGQMLLSHIKWLHTHQTSP